MKISIELNEREEKPAIRKLIAALTTMYLDGADNSGMKSDADNMVKTTSVAFDITALPPGALKGGDNTETFTAAELAPVEPVAHIIPPPPAAMPGADPLDMAALFAPSTAVVAPPPTAPVGLPVISMPPSVGVPPAPPAASVAGVPSQPVAPTNHASAALDKDGLPWDSRIHSSSKEQNKDGTWRKKKGIDKELTPVIESELRRIMAVPTTANGAGASPLVAPMNGTVPPLPAGVGAGNPTQPAPAVTAFAQFMMQVTPHVKSEANPAGRLTPQEIAYFAKHIGLSDADGNGNIMMLQHREDLIPQMQQLINSHLAGSTQ